MVKVEGEEEEEETEGFVLCRYMNRMGHNQFSWDKKPDILKTLRTDILRQTPPPVPVSSMRPYYGYSKEVLKSVEALFRVSDVVNRYRYQYQHFLILKQLFLIIKALDGCFF